MVARILNQERGMSKNKAEEILRKLREAMSSGTNISGAILWLAREKRAVQKRVLDALRGPAKVGRGKNLIRDEEWLAGVESWRALMESGATPGKKFTDLEVIADWLKTTSTRYGRDKPFREHTESGKREIKRIRDAIGRAKRNRKKAVEMA